MPNMVRLFVSVSFVVVLLPMFAIAAEADAPKSCLEEDRGYKLINADGSIDPVRLYGAAVKKFSASSLNGQAPTQVKQFGVTTGDPREWARLFVMLCKQESGCRIARTYADGSLQKFSSTPQGERSYGPLQFNIGEYGLTSWAMVNSPSCTLEAVIRVAQQNKLLNYFGSMQRPNEVLQHANWFNTTVKPFADALTLVFDPTAQDNSATYRALTPYFSNPYSATPTYGSPYSTNTYSPVGITPYTAQGATTNGLAPVSSLLTNQTSPLNLSTSGGGQATAAAQTNVDATGTTGYSAGTIIVQPQTARSGASVLVSWTSVNMRPASCTVTKNGSAFATGNEASKRDIMEGAVEYVLACTAADGSTATSKASIAF